MSPRRRTILFILLAFAALCAVAVINVTLLGGSGKYRRPGIGTSVSVGDCVTIQERRTACGDEDAWYRVTKQRPTSDGCSSGRRRSEDGRFCLERLEPIDVEVDIPEIDLEPR